MGKLILKPKFKGKPSLDDYRLNSHYHYLLRYINLESISRVNFSKIDYLHTLLEDLESVINSKYDVLGSLKGYFLETAERRKRKFGCRYIIYLLKLLDKENIDKGGNDKEFNSAVRNLKFLWGKYWLPFVKSGYFFLHKASGELNDYFTLDASQDKSEKEDYSFKAEFNVAIYCSLKSQFITFPIEDSYYPSYKPVWFIALVNEFIEIIKLFIADHELIIETIMEGRDDASSKINFLERVDLLHWILIALKEDIGFEDLPKDVKYKKLQLFKILESEAFVWNCIPNYEQIKNVILNPLKETNQDQFQTVHLQPKFKINPDKLSKINLIRLLEVLYDGGYIVNEGRNKKKFMVQFGNLLGVKLDDYANNSRTEISSNFDNEKFFKELGACSKELFENKIEEKKNKN